MFTANSTRLLRHASRTLARLMERENKSGSALTAENMSILRKSMKNFINRINARLSPRVVSDDQYLADLEALSELSKLSADQLNSSVLAQEKELFQKYFREKGHYKLDLLEKYFNSYFSINVPDNNADQQTWDEYHSSINSFKSSLEGSHSSFVSHILEEVKKKEDEYISEISKYFDQVIADQFASQMERVELCNRLKLPVKNYLSGSGKNIPDPAAGSSGRTEPYQTANLGNAKQQKFFQSSGAQNSSAGNNPQKEPSERKTGRDAGSQPGKQQKTKNRYDELTDRMMDDYHNGRPYQNSEQEKRDSNASSAPPPTPAPPSENENSGKSASPQLPGTGQSQSGGSGTAQAQAGENSSSERAGGEPQQQNNSSGTGPQPASGTEPEEPGQNRNGKPRPGRQRSGGIGLADVPPQQQENTAGSGESSEGEQTGDSSRRATSKSAGENEQSGGTSGSDAKTDPAGQADADPPGEEQSGSGERSSDQENKSANDSSGSGINSQTRFIQELSQALSRMSADQKMPRPAAVTQDNVPEGAKGTGQYAMAADLDPSMSDEGSEIDAPAEYDLGKFLESGDADFSDEQFSGSGSGEADGQSSGAGSSSAGSGGEQPAEDFDLESVKSIADYLKELGYNSDFGADPSYFWPYQYWNIPKPGGRFAYDLPPQSPFGETPDAPDQQQPEPGTDEQDLEDDDDDEQFINELVESILSSNIQTKKQSFNPAGKNKGIIRQSDDQFIHYFGIIQHNTGLQKLLNRLGRCMDLDRSQEDRAREDFNSSRNKNKANSPESISGITLGNEISYVLPQELVKINDPVVEPLFDINYLERNLIRFDLEGIADLNEGQEKIPSSPSHERGPVILCVDTSSSMQGIPESYAKAVVMSLATKCVSAKRDCFIINFSVSIEKLLVNRKTADPEKTISGFLSKSFNGGSDLDEALTECLYLMENDPAFFRSDVLCVTDGRVKYSPALVELINKRKKNEKNNFYELLISTAYADQYMYSLENIDNLDPMRLFDIIFRLNRDGNTLVEYRNGKVKNFY